MCGIQFFIFKHRQTGPAVSENHHVLTSVVKLVVSYSPTLQHLSQRVHERNL